MFPEDEISGQMNTNFFGVVNMCKVVLPYMRKARRGKIINISSIGGVMGIPYQGFYSASNDIICPTASWIERILVTSATSIFTLFMFPEGFLLVP